MDSELNFFAALLRGSSAEQDEFYVKQIPKGIFAEHSAEASWIYKFREQHGRYPSAANFNSRFGVTLKRTNDTAAIALQPLLDRSMFEQMCRVQEETKKLIDAGEPLEVAMESFKNGASRLSSFGFSYNDVDFRRSQSSVNRYMELRRKLRDPKASMMTSPWPSMNAMISFLRQGETMAVAARTSMGKTFILIYWAWHLAKLGLRVLFITKEMTVATIEDRFEALCYRIPYDLLRAGKLPRKLLIRWLRQRQTGKHLPDNLIITGKSELKASDGFGPVIAKIKQYKPDIVFGDGWYLLYPEELPSGASEVARFTRISNMTNAIAKSLGVAFVFSIQVNRTGETAKGIQRAGLSGLYGADAWGQDSDFVAELYGKRGSPSRELSLIKGRESAIGGLNLNFRLNPFPDFSELSGQPSTVETVGKPPNSISFKGVA